MCDSNRRTPLWRERCFRADIFQSIKATHKRRACASLDQQVIWQYFRQGLSTMVNRLGVSSISERSRVPAVRTAEATTSPVVRRHGQPPAAMPPPCRGASAGAQPPPVMSSRSSRGPSTEHNGHPPCTNSCGSSSAAHDLTSASSPLSLRMPGCRSSGRS